ncbi:hypothetical protein QUF74_16500 [Candidatus Halobeggiatoa sp. HSG11]|nr:hypothetical protein [Candidatus Halobeggiatoa sp. HSG11]
MKAIQIFITLGISIFVGITSAASRDLVFPFEQGETWYVCQGYNTNQITHHNDYRTIQLKYSFDLTTEPNSTPPWSTYGCNGDRKHAKRKSVLSPGTGTVAKEKYAAASDMMCINLNNGGSIMLGHFDVDKSKFYTGQTVTVNQEVGKLATSNVKGNNAYYSHIHMSLYKYNNCKKNIPFGDRFESGDFYNDRSRYQWRKTALEKTGLEIKDFWWNEPSNLSPNLSNALDSQFKIVNTSSSRTLYIDKVVLSIYRENNTQYDDLKIEKNVVIYPNRTWPSTSEGFRAIVDAPDEPGNYKLVAITYKDGKWTHHQDIPFTVTINYGKARDVLNRCSDYFSPYIGNKVGTAYSENGYYVQHVTGTFKYDITKLRIKNDKPDELLEFYWYNVWHSLELPDWNYCKF